MFDLCVKSEFEIFEWFTLILLDKKREVGFVIMSFDIK